MPGCSHAGAAATSCPSLLSVPLPSPAPERGRNGFGATPENPKPRGGGEDAQELAGTDLVPRMRAGLGLLEPDPQEEQGRVASLACLITCPALCCSFFLSSRRNAWRDGRPLPSPIHGGDWFGFVWVCFSSALVGITSQKWPPKKQEGTNQQGTNLPSKKFPCAPGGSCVENTDPGGEPKFPGSFPTLCFPSGPCKLPPRGPSGEGAVPFLQVFGVFPWISPFPPQPYRAQGCPQPCLCR